MENCTRERTTVQWSSLKRKAETLGIEISVKTPRQLCESINEKLAAQEQAKQQLYRQQALQRGLPLAPLKTLSSSPLPLPAQTLAPQKAEEHILPPAKTSDEGVLQEEPPKTSDEKVPQIDKGVLKPDERVPQIDKTKAEHLTTRFYMIGKLGAGAYGTIWHAIEKASGKDYALKLLKQIDEQTEREVDALKSLSVPTCHPNIVCYCNQFTATYGTNSYHVIQMEYIDGITLNQWFDDWFVKHPNKDGKIQQPEREIVYEMVKSAFRGLATVHDHGVLHLDMKPPNLMVRKGSNQIVLIDFGFSCTRHAEPTDLVRGCIKNNRAGTPLFFSPDRIYHCVQKNDGCSHQVLEKADVFALALSFYDVLSQRGIDTIAERLSISTLEEWYVTNHFQVKTWQESEVYSLDKKIDAVLRSALDGNDSKRPTAKQIYESFT